MKNVLICFYRDWANNIVKNITSNFSNEINLTLATDQNQFLDSINTKKYDIIFFLGWSEIIEKKIVDNNFCICLHPSLLPRYRGGSPIQNQIINGETISGVTLFKMDENIDTGPILFQEEFNLEDIDLDEIFELIIEKGTKGCFSILENLINNVELPLTKQNEEDSSYYKRRSEKMSEITVEDFKNLTSQEIHNKIRCLQDPYPNAFIKCKDGSVLFLKKSNYSL